MNKIGLKIRNNNFNSFPVLKKFYQEKIIDFLEVYIVPNENNPQKLSCLKGVPIIFHAPNFNHNFNLRVKNIFYDSAIKTIKNYVDFFNEYRVIFHPGISINKNDNEVVINNIKNLKEFGFDVILENVPKIAIDKKITLIASRLEDFREILEKTKAKFCLDIGHAIKSANYHRKDPLKYLTLFSKLDPYLLHISDGNYETNIDEHLNLGQGSFPLNKIFKNLHLKNKMLTLETPKKDLQNLTNDLKNIERLKKFYNAN